MSTTSELYCGEQLGAIITNCYCTEDTWFGNYEIQASGNRSHEDGIIDFIKCSEDWHRRLRTNESDPPDASEFDQFEDLINGTIWRAKFLDGTHIQIVGAPIFFGQGSVSWRSKNTTT